MADALCKCCGQNAKLIGSVDFNKTCHDRIAGRVFPLSDVLVPYYQCKNCGFVFSNFMDSWSLKDFREKIYNEDYHKADGALPGFENAGRRQTVSYQNGLRLVSLLKGGEGVIRVLDYGSGGDPGDTGLALMDAGFHVTSYEPYFSDSAINVNGKFDFIYLIEVIEHCHELDEVCHFLNEHLSDGGLIHIQTLLHPYPSPDNILGSWYISPRNGHISIFTFQALAVLFRRFGLNVVNTLFGVVAFRQAPKFANQFFI